MKLKKISNLNVIDQTFQLLCETNLKSGQTTNSKFWQYLRKPFNVKQYKTYHSVAHKTQPYRTTRTITYKTY